MQRLTLTEALARGAGWWSAADDAAPRSPFTGWDWHQSWAAAADPATLAACSVLVLPGEDGRPRALLPVARRRVPFRRMQVPALTWALDDLGCPDHLDFHADAETDFGALVTALEAEPWDLLLLDDVAATAPATEALARALAQRGYDVRFEPRWSCPYLELPADWNAYLASLSPTRRQTIRRKESRLARERAFTVTDYGADRLDEGWGHLLALHDQRWSGAGVFHNGPLERLNRDFAERLAARGQLWLATLDIDGAPAAAWYGFAVGDTVSFYQGGKDPQWHRESVGHVLMGIMIRRAIERGFRRFDFLRGPESYKADWTSADRPTRQLFAFRPSWRRPLLRGLDWASQLRRRWQAPAATGA